jgi:Domain of unknown function (DUF4145)
LRFREEDAFLERRLGGDTENSSLSVDDRVYDLCQEVIPQTSEEEAASGDLGHLLVEWAKLEEQLLPPARRLTGKNISAGEAIRALAKRGLIDNEIASRLDEVRRVRNTAAHRPGQIRESELQRALEKLRQLTRWIEANRI